MASVSVARTSAMSRASRAFDTRFAGVVGRIPRAEQRFAGVDIAYADDEMIVHQRKLDRRGPGAYRAVEVGRVARGVEGLRAEAREQRMRFRRRRQPEHRAEAARIAIAQRDARVQNDVDMVVRLPRRRIR